MTTLEVSPEVRARRLAWIEALESDEYPQARYMLGNGCGYCCIGVGGMVLLPADERRPHPRHGLPLPPVSAYERLGTVLDFDARFSIHLQDMNDDRERDFRFIARFLRKAWGLT